jgi:hypothetical protein
MRVYIVPADDYSPLQRRRRNFVVAKLGEKGRGFLKALFIRPQHSKASPNNQIDLTFFSLKFMDLDCLRHCFSAVDNLDRLDVIKQF